MTVAQAMACTFNEKLTINSWPKPSWLHRSTNARHTSIGFGRNTYVEVAHTISNTAIWNTTMNRNAGLEITRFGEKAPSNSCQELSPPGAGVGRIAAAGAPASIPPVAGFMGFPRT